MAKHDQPSRPISLARYFEAPENHIGWFGYVCGYSADAGFFDIALEYFSGQVRSKRAASGQVRMLLMLDPGSPQITPADVPGLLQVPLKKVREKNFRLLHAKVALLGFRSLSEPDNWCVRLIISTGNWTKQTLEESVDLVWSADLEAQDMENSTDNLMQIRSDIDAAHGFLKDLLKEFDTRALKDVASNSRDARDDFEHWLKQISGRTKGHLSRFVDNRERSFLEQLPEQVRELCTSTRRNYLAMGSGFFETTIGQAKEQTALGVIPSVLIEAKLLTGTPEIEVFVNPRACQGVADGISTIQDDWLWSVRPAAIPPWANSNAPPSLHAKFLFSANYRASSYHFTAGWAYLGSANLTSPGFLKVAGRNLGNLEAGVIFPTLDQTYWEPGRAVPDSSVIANYLPLQWDSDVGGEKDQLSTGSDMPERTIMFEAPPVSYLSWSAMSESADQGLLEPYGGESIGTFEIMIGANASCARDSEGRYVWDAPRPAQVRVRWRSNDEPREAYVPVIDGLGRLAASELPSLDLEDALAEIEAFPDTGTWWDEEDEESQEPGNSGGQPKNERTPREKNVVEKPTRTSISDRYPIRTMMQMLERIADRQTRLAPGDWRAWCGRLEQTLIQATGSETVEYFRQLELNPIGVLRLPPFLPVFAEAPGNDDLNRLSASLERVEDAWRVRGFDTIGGNQ